MTKPSTTLTAFPTRRDTLLVLLLSPLIPCSTSYVSAADSLGSFVGRVVAEWDPGGRLMRLLEPFEYVGPNGRRWPVPSGIIVDGASIPQPFWSLIGGPFEGPYRQASVIHDYFCDVRTRRYEDVHRMFYDAMLAARVRAQRAWLMYQAVARFGPRWPDPKVDPNCEIVDENYDYERCARNAAKPPMEQPNTDRAELFQFLDKVEAQADPDDIALLRRSFGG